MAVSFSLPTHCSPLSILIISFSADFASGRDSPHTYSAIVSAIAFAPVAAILTSIFVSIGTCNVALSHLTPHSQKRTPDSPELTASHKKGIRLDGCKTNSSSHIARIVSRMSVSVSHADC